MSLHQLSLSGVKPFLNRTVLSVDIEVYKKYMQQYGLVVVAGRRFLEGSQGEPAPIAPGRLRVIKNFEYDVFVEKLKNAGRVYGRSIEVFCS